MNSAVQPYAELLLLINDIDELNGMYDTTSDYLAAIEARIEELEQERGNPERREQISDYFASR